MAHLRRRTPAATVALVALLCGSVAGRPAAAADRLGPFSIGSEDGSARLRVGFAAQLLVAVLNASDPGGGRETTGELRARRVREILHGALLDGALQLHLQLSTAPGSLELMDLWGQYRVARWLRLRLGQLKIPLTRHRWQSFSTLVLADWAVAASRFGDERQVGGLASGEVGVAGLRYALGLFSGVGARSSFATGVPLSYAEPLPNPSDLRDPAPPADFHPELVLRLSHESDDVSPQSNSDRAPARRGLRHLVALGVAWDAQPVEGRDYALRLAAEVLLKLRGVSLDLVGYAGFFRSSAVDLAAGALGVTAEAAWAIGKRFELAARFSRVDFLERMRDDARRRAQQLVDDAPAGEQQGLRAQYAAAGAVEAQQELGGAFNVYLVGHSLKWQTDLSWVRERRAEDLRDSLRLRTQAQVCF